MPKLKYFNNNTHQWEYAEAVDTRLGDLTKLNTKSKTDIVGAINEIKAKTVLVTATSNNTTHIVHNLPYDVNNVLQVIDVAYGTVLEKDVNYTENPDKVSIDLLGWSISTGEKLRFNLF